MGTHTRTHIYSRRVENKVNNNNGWKFELKTQHSKLNTKIWSKQTHSFWRWLRTMHDTVNFSFFLLSWRREKTRYTQSKNHTRTNNNLNEILLWIKQKLANMKKTNRAEPKSSEQFHQGKINNVVNLKWSRQMILNFQTTNRWGDKKSLENV